MTHHPARSDTRAARAQEPSRLPVLAGRSLDGEPYELPGDLPKRYSFIVAAFRREQQALVDQWLAWLTDLEDLRSDVASYELPVLSTVYRPARWLIDGGMARGVPDASARTRTITVYTDVRKVVRDLALAGTDTIAVLLLERPGDIIARELGAFDQQKAKRLAAALEPERIARA
ncbi:MAG: hypothetical protein ACLQMH_09670 [Solirubrobacteraceae bacterium]